MVPFTYLLATIASVLAAVMAMAGSVLILSLTLGSSVSRAHLGSILLADEDFRLAVTGGMVTIVAACMALLAAHVPMVSHSAQAVFALSLGGVVEFAAVVVALARLFQRIPRLLTQETLLDSSLAGVDAAYLATQERRLLGADASDRGRAEVLNDLIFSFRIYPVDTDDPLVTVHDVLENVLTESPASVATTSLALVATRFSDLASKEHDRVYQLLVTPWFSELRIAVVRRGSPSIALAYFDLWADVLISCQQKSLGLFFANSARPFVAALNQVARAGLFEGTAERALRPLARTMAAAGGDANALGPWGGALVAWMREDVARERGVWARMLWSPIENVLDLYLFDLEKDSQLLDVLIHGLTGVVRAAARSGVETASGRPFALKLAKKLRRAQLDMSALTSRTGLAPEKVARGARRVALLGEPVNALLEYVSTRPELAHAAEILASKEIAPDERDGEA